MMAWLAAAGWMVLVAGTACTVIALPRVTHAVIAYLVASPVGVGFVLWACWQWSALPTTEPAISHRVRRSLRAVSLGALAAAIGFGALTFDWVRISLQPNTTVHSDVFVVGGYGLSALGLGLASLGLWIGSSTDAAVAEPSPQDHRSETAPSVG